MSLKSHCLILDLKPDDALIREYEQYHVRIWPEIEKSILDAGITALRIYRAGNRLVMMMEVNEHFSFDAKARADAGNPKVQEWERLMWNYQQAVPFARPGEKWVLTKQIFDLTDHSR